jgi:hypothetical protein
VSRFNNLEIASVEHPFYACSPLTESACHITNAKVGKPKLVFLKLKDFTCKVHKHRVKLFFSQWQKLFQSYQPIKKLKNELLSQNPFLESPQP